MQPTKPNTAAQRSRRSPLVSLLITVLVLLGITLLNALLTLRFQFVDNASELYILGVLLISLNTPGYLWGVLGSLVGVLCVNFFFTYPYGHVNFALEGYPITFFVMLTVAICTSALGGRVKNQRELAEERRRLTEERQAILIETEKEKMRGNLLRAISHDLRTPLTGILGASGALIDNAGRIDPDASRELLSGIHEDAEWLLRMVENVLSVTRISGSVTALRKVAEPLDEVFAQVVAKARKRFPEIELTVTVPDEVMLVPMDETLIVQVLVNLIDNAIRHGGSPRVELSAAAEADDVRITVRDHGRGFPPNEDVFECFAPRDNLENDTTRGLGIGLSICKTIVQAHGGQITAENPKDGGAAVSFTLPIQEVAKENAQQ